MPSHDLRVIAHRGASGARAEHTRAAFELALEAGADGLECDIRLTADGVPVCWHDPDVDRTSDGHGPVAGYALAALRELDVTSWSGRPSGPPPQVVTLAELVALATAAGRPVHLAVELKHPAPYGWAAEDAVLEVLAGAGWSARTGRIGEVELDLMSFDPDALDHLAGTVAPDRLMILLDQDEPGTDPDQVVAGASDGRVGGIGPSVALLRSRPEQVRSWLAAGRRVRAWTVDEPGDLELCLRLGVPEVTTNEPARLLSLLGR